MISTIFGPLKKHLTGKRFATDADVKQVIASWPQTLDTDFLCAGVQALAPQGTDAQMRMVTTWRSDVYRMFLRCHVGPTHQSYSKYFGISVLTCFAIWLC